MSVIVVGLEQRQAPLDLLEQVAISEDDLPKALSRLQDLGNISEAVVLSTCLRTEIYAVVERFHEGVAELQEFLASLGGRPGESLTDHLSIRFDDEVTAHLFSVAAGLDSAVLGESEVLGQVRRSWERAQAEDASGPVLGSLFRHAVEAGKRVRSETAIARGITSLSHGAVAIAAGRRPGGLQGARVLVVGAGEMGEGVTQALADHDVASVAVANRTSDRRDAVISNWPEGRPVQPRGTDLEGLVEELGEADVVFTTVATTHPIIDREMVEVAVAGREGSAPLLIVDLGVPRNVAPAAAALATVVLLDMEVLRSAVEDALSGRQEQAVLAAEIVAEEVERHRVDVRARSAAPTIAALRRQVDELRSAELERLRAKNGDLTDEQWEQIDVMSRALANKLLHGPTVALKEAAGTPRGERMTEALRALFDL